jgi:hypothetical protein
VKPMLKPPGTKRWKVKYDKLLSNFAFKFNLRRYSLWMDDDEEVGEAADEEDAWGFS